MFAQRRIAARCTAHVVPNTWVSPYARTLTTLGHHKKCIGIVRETKNKWERRVALVPEAVRQLVESGIQVLVQPSERRVFKDSEYAQAGAIITDDLTPANTIFAVKQVPVHDLLPNKTYVFFAHVIKAQPENMPILDACVARNIRLIDYEGIRAPASQGGQRLVAFGRYAGLAGMVDGLHGLGKRLLSLGYSTPFMGLSQSYSYPSLEACKQAVYNVGEEIARVGTPAKLGPITFAFTGSGNVGQGAFEMFSLLPHEKIPARELARAAAMKPPPGKGYQKVIAVQTEVQDLVEPIDNSHPFSVGHYFQNPDKYRPVFHERVAPYTSVLVNGIYWDRRYPRLLTRDQMASMNPQTPLGLLHVADISCDIEGSVEFTSHSTTIDAPFYTYDPLTRTESIDPDAPGVLVLAVDNLPAEFPKESSRHFSSQLTHFVDAISTSDHATPLPEELESACITRQGSLTPQYKYIQKLRENVQSRIEPTKSEAPQHTSAILLEGHLFDSGLINHVLNIIEKSQASFDVLHWSVGLDRHRKSTAVIQVLADSQQTIDDIVHKVDKLCSVVDSAEAVLKILPHASKYKRTAGLPDTSAAATPGPTSAGGPPSPTPAAFNVAVATPTKHVLVLGSGYVSGPVVEFLSAPENRIGVVLASGHEEAQRKQRQHITSTVNSPYVTEVALDALNTAELSKHVERSDVVVSLLPAFMHLPIADLCLEHGKHLVTASYVSDGMRQRHEAAVQKGVTFANEMGLDPGLDHMSAMKIIHDVQNHGGFVKGFQSLCGGLPAPECADNPLGYKFSWSPRGVLTAALNAAQYKRDGKIVNVDGQNLLRAAQPFLLPTYPGLRMEQIPNRNSLQYQTLYGLKDVQTMYRGTLRYEGFCGVMDCFVKLGLFDQTVNKSRKQQLPNEANWSRMLATVLGQSESSRQELHAAMRAKLTAAGTPPATVDKCLATADWLGLTSDKEQAPLFGMTGASVSDATALDTFCALLQKKLVLGPNERDLVVMHHEFEAVYKNKQERITSSLVLAGDSRWSAMARTVGLPTAIATKMLLTGGIAPGLGVVIPTTPNIYNPVLSILEDHNINFVERIETL